MLTVRTSENTVITSFRLISERQDFSSVRTAENTVRARARIQESLPGRKLIILKTCSFCRLVDLQEKGRPDGGRPKSI